MTRSGVNVCPEAWYLQRRHVRPTSETVERLDAGTLAHAAIGAGTDRLRSLNRRRSVLLAAAGVLTVAIAFELLERLAAR
jgi:hypothetical protein